MKLRGRKRLEKSCDFLIWKVLGGGGALRGLKRLTYDGVVYFYFRYPLVGSSTTCFYLHEPPAHTLHVLQLNLFVQNIDSLGITFGCHTTVLPYASELCRLVSRLPFIKMFYISLSAHSLSPGAPHPGWQMEIIWLLDLVVKKPCVLLSVLALSSLPYYYWHIRSHGQSLRIYILCSSSFLPQLSSPIPDI